MQKTAAEIWDEGYAAGDRDAYAYSQAQAAGPRTAENYLADGGTENPYAGTDTRPVTNDDLWRN